MVKIYKEKYSLLGYTFKSFLEYYFALYLEELKEKGFVKQWEYEENTFKLFDGVSRPYKKQLKTKIKDCDEHILQKASCTADFTIWWDIKGKNIFYSFPLLPITGNIGDIPFRLAKGLDLVSYIEVKSTNMSTTSSSTSFPYKQKWVYEKYGVLIQKIYPFSPKKDKKVLFQQTFYPKKVILDQVYKRDCKWGNKGESKIKFPIKTIDEFLNEF